MVAAGDAGDHSGRHRRRAAAKHQAVLGAFKRRDLLPQDLDRRVVAARVDVAPELVTKTRAHRGDSRKREDRRLHDRWRDRAEITFAVFAEVVKDPAQVHEDQAPVRV